METRLYGSEADLSILPMDKRYQHVAVGGTRNSTTSSMIVKFGLCFFSIFSAAVVNSVNCTRNLGDDYKTRFNNSNGDWRRYIN